MQEFSHIKDDRAYMVDISNKDTVVRYATASGKIKLHDETVEKIRSGDVEKGNVLATARTAAILAVKRTPDLIPMCHQIPITSVDVEFEIGKSDVTANVEVKSVGRTGVEMEALTGVSVALLTIWDMVKSAEKDNTGNYPSTAIENIHVIRKVKETITNQ
ncbi:cyclic pyranopterin monophosphate synthase MoaC [Methanococcoides burtonii]|uniref:Probable cyclic pyranopterin monophosphate synthase n=1 Tax=Methanococcoides burtonii (strain DSM 6242 / NBRC 107633 / OCM 468 / ACE-M) TaxID=259564 RepID=MOAC_METBU|nr:cyclic pyranopterin monophosphate synthase MoaC [Methanococcoides burtonii]Q12UW5.1 RecName: Full=Probable cyclic pyranopterin monophosphate synthase; AltName: Full=Molybdenum cofactor biosynthesis protein C [Methanococcoides burtonii DSM 6242]ABE52761.1 Molybdenum cofactor biosynthesis protein C [Methanococcoides burtonii DSM 6242]